MNKKKYFIDELGNRYRYVLCYLWYGRDYDKFSNNLDELEDYADNMVKENSGKPLIIVNGNDEIVKEYAKRRR